MNIQSHRWHKSAMALAAAALFGLTAPYANALSLGNIIVQSALGEPLRAEIDIPEMNADEAATLKANVASPEAFRAAGLEFNAALSGLRTSIQRRANGRAYIRLTSDRPVNDPFVDMILEASWNTGRIVRDYTMLFDPPNLRLGAAGPTAAATNAAQSSPVQAQSARGATTSPSTPPPSNGGAPARLGAVRPAAVAAAKPSVAVDGQVTVKRGDTASRIAMATKPATVSLDQMLVALLRANPEAFINSNINRIKSGAVINVPTPEQAQAIGAAEATQTVIAQSRDFGDFRKKLATNAPAAQVAAADRQSGGSVQAQVDDKKPSSVAPDKLTLSKGALKAQAETARIAKERASKDAATRTAEVNKNMSDLAKLGAVPAGAVVGAAAPTSAASAAKPAAAATAPVPSPVTSPAPAAVPASAPVMTYTPPAAAPVAAPASVPTTAAVTPAAPAASAPVATASVAKPAVKPTPAPVEEPTLIDQLTADPLIPAAGLGLVALLAGFGIYRSRQRKKAAMEDSVFLESRLQPDSFFGASGGQKVDTQDNAGGSSMVYTPSQLDAADDVDPVAEADVYLAYGRDVQAEEILREALKFSPGRIAIHQKLLEIFAKRRDLTAFESAARDAFKATNGEGPDWVRVCELGLSIDPTNSLYQAGGMPSFAVPLEAAPAAEKSVGAGPGATWGAGAVAVAGAAMAGNTASDAASSFGAATTPMTPAPVAAGPGDLSFDLDLDFSLDEENANVIKDLATSERTSRMAPLSSGFGTLDLSVDPPSTTAPQPLAPITQGIGDGSLEFELPDAATKVKPGLTMGEAEEFKKEAAVSFGTTVSGPLATLAVKAPEPAPNDAGMLEFDLGSLSLDLNNSTEGSSLEQTAALSVQDDPLATKLSLAEEFNAIGDDDGARALIEEVIAEASGEMKTRAQAALAKLN